MAYRPGIMATAALLAVTTVTARSAEPENGASPQPARSIARAALNEIAAWRMGDRVSFELPEGGRASGVITRRTDRSEQRFTIAGPIDSVMQGNFILAVNQDAIVGVIRAGAQGTYRLRKVGDAPLSLERLDADGSFECGVGGQRFDLAGVPPASPAAGDDCDDGSVIDVLIVYTPEARAEAGGVPAIEAMIDLMIEDNNIAYKNSDIDTRMDVVYIRQLLVDEDDVSLGRLTNPDDGYMDGVHILRDAYGADQVALIRSGGGGVANGLWNLEPESQAFAFCVNGIASAPNFVLAHELGHNMGCCHAWGDGGGCPSEGGLLFPFSNGHRFFGDSGTLWRTVMAYSPGTRIDHFSNPLLDFDGQPTGVPEGEPFEADNTRTVNLSTYTVSNWRCNDHICEDLDLPSGAEDCNGNDVPDACEIAIGLEADADGNGVLDICELVGDIDGDLDVDSTDLARLLAYWGDCDDCPADFDGDGDVDSADLAILLSNWTV